MAEPPRYLELIVKRRKGRDERVWLRAQAALDAPLMWWVIAAILAIALVAVTGALVK